MAGCLVRRPEPTGGVGASGASFVTLVQQDDVWWFVQDGRRSLSLGVNGVFAKEVNYLPGGAPYALAYDGVALHGGDGRAWSAETAERLRAWGFTMLGAWSEGDLAQASGLPETRCVWLGGYRSQPDNRLVDVWDPAYAGMIEAQAREQIAPQAEDAKIAGFFLNNELPWYGAHGWPSGTKDSLVARYMELALEQPGKRKLLEFLAAFYARDWAAFSQDWKVEADSFDNLFSARAIAPRKPSHLRAVEAWAGQVAEQYFRITDEALTRHAPHHLNLGVRFAGRPYAPVLAACAKYADVVSLNDYAPKGEFNGAVMDAIAALVKKPILITEMSWRAMENQSGCPNHGGAPVTVATQQDRADAFRRYTEEALRRPYVIGYHWFSWADQPPGGRYDGEDSNYGVVDIRGNPYAVLVAAMRDVNARADSRHAAGAGRTLVPAPELLAAYRVPALPPAAPADGPACLALTSGGARAWADAAFPPSVLLETTSTGLVFCLRALQGWGGGLSVPAPADAALHADGSYSVAGTAWLAVEVDAPPGIRFRLILNESGAAPPGEQVYHGLGTADGESYISEELVTRGGVETIEIHLQSLSLNPAFGNGRGNHVVDLTFLRGLDMMFSVGQPDACGCLRSACFRPDQPSSVTGAPP